MPKLLPLLATVFASHIPDPPWSSAIVLQMMQTVADGGSEAFGGLAIALGKTLVVVVFGYVLGTLRICDPSAGKGLSQFLTWVAFPSLIFHGIITMELGQLSWVVFSCILVGKIIPMTLMVWLPFELLL